MKTLEHGQEKIQKICNELREVTLEPAKKQAEQMIEEAHKRSQEIIKEGEAEVKKMIEEARELLEKEKNVFQSSLSQAMKQSLEALKQDIQSKLFNEHLTEMVRKETVQPDVIAKLIDCIVKAIDSQGISADISALIPAQIPAKEVNLLLIADVLKKLKNQSVQIGSFGGGAQIKVVEKGLTIDISDLAIKELLLRYIPKDLRKKVFSESL